MRSIATTGTVAPDGTLTAQVPADVPPGEHRIVVMVEEEPNAEARPPLDLPPPLDFGPWPEGLSLRREDMYDDWGR